MGISAGEKLGPYEIVSALGAGGMGEVYRARDTRLDRTVAIKVLSSQLGSTPDLRQRFEREARAISQLNHPHICTLHDIGHDSGTDYLVMEFIEGESLAARLRKAPLPMAELLKISAQLADALDKAHSAGIIHRDLKPANVMLTKSGAKLLDFGLAKPVALAAGAGSGSAPSLSAAITMTSPPPQSQLTQHGALVGTVQYMSPEQIQGMEVDARSDIFAFGATLYEMATGKRAFDGKSQASIVGAILANDPPPVTTIDPTASPALARLISRCLLKDPDDRFHCMHDLKLQLDEIASSQAEVAQKANRLPAWRRALPWALASALLVSAFVLLVRRPALPARDIARFEIELGALTPSASKAGSRVAISPNGRTVVFSAITAASSVPQLYSRSLDDVEIHGLAGTNGGMQPFFSPDGQWIGFSTEGKLEKLSVSGGLPVVICDVPFSPTGTSAAWADNGFIYLTGRNIGTGDLYRVRESGGTPEKIASPDVEKGERFMWLDALPGSRGLLVTVITNNLGYDVDVLSLSTGKRSNLVRGGSWARLLSSNYLLFAQYSSAADSAGFTGGLLAVPFDVKRLVRTGDAVPVIDGVRVGGGGAGYFDAAQNGTLVYQPGSGQSSAYVLYWLQPDGALGAPLSAPPMLYLNPHFSRDGKKVALRAGSVSSRDVDVFDVERGTLQRVTFDGNNYSPVFTPDATRVIYGSSAKASDPLNIWSKSSDGSGAAERLTTSSANQAPDSVSPDGSVLAFTQTTPRGSEIHMLPLRGERKPQPFVTSASSAFAAAFSPEGKWLAYTSDETGSNEVYVIAYPSGSNKQLVSAGGGAYPAWSHDGKMLYYQVGDSIVALEITTTGRVRVGTPRKLASGLWLVDGKFFDPAPDGRLLIAQGTQSADEQKRRLRVVQNFDALVRQRIPSP